MYQTTVWISGEEGRREVIMTIKGTTSGGNIIIKDGTSYLLGPLTYITKGGNFP